MDLEKVDVLFSGGSVLTMNGDRTVIENGAIATRGSEIVYVGDAAAANRFHPKQTIDTTGKVVTPGLINVHSHIAMTLFRGLVDDQPLEAWLSTIWGFEQRLTTPDNVAAGARLAMVEMIKAGTTCVADMYWRFQRTTEEAVKANFRMVNGPSFTDIEGFDEIRNRQLSAAKEYLDEYRRHPLIHACMQVHSTYTIQPERLEQARRMVEDYDLLFITHASESRAEVAQVKEKFGRSPIGVLEDFNMLGRRTLLAHCVHLSDDEIQLLAEKGVSVAHCPESNLKLGSGIARVPEMLAAGVNVAIGTDGPASNNNLDLLGEARTSALLYKGVNCDPTTMPAWKMLEMLTIHGARAIGMGERLGSLETGKLADVVVWDFTAPHLTPCYDPYSHLIYASSANDAETVMIHGKLVMDQRQMVTLDEEKIKADVLKIRRKEINKSK